jgi:cysteine desulfurase/selenocysteine lyase
MNNQKSIVKGQGLKIKEYFKIFKNSPDLVYLDNASSTQTPDVVVGAMNEYYEEYRSNVHRGLYDIGVRATDAYENARQTVAHFLNADYTEIVFTSGATHGLNLLAASLGQELSSKDNVVLTRMEHHANLVPWFNASKKYGFELRFIELDENYRLDLNNAAELIDKNTKIVSITHASNVLGVINPVEKIIAMAQKVQAITILDSAQYVPHKKVDVQKLECDFLVFSGHKICGPTGVGVLYGKKEKLNKLEPFMTGGEMVETVSFTDVKYKEAPWKFEPGTPNIAGAIGLATTVKYIDYDLIENSEKIIKDEVNKRIGELENAAVKLLGPEANDEDRLAVYSFVIDGVHPHDAAQVLAGLNICVRAGKHCAMPLLTLIGQQATLRASFYFYNTAEDVEKLFSGLQEAIKKLR